MWWPSMDSWVSNGKSNEYEGKLGMGTRSDGGSWPGPGTVAGAAAAAATGAPGAGADAGSGVPAPPSALTTPSNRGGGGGPHTVCNCGCWLSASAPDSGHGNGCVLIVFSVGASKHGSDLMPTDAAAAAAAAPAPRAAAPMAAAKGSSRATCPCSALTVPLPPARWLRRSSRQASTALWWEKWTFHAPAQLQRHTSICPAYSRSRCARPFFLVRFRFLTAGSCARYDTTCPCALVRGSTLPGLGTVSMRRCTHTGTSDFVDLRSLRSIVASATLLALPPPAADSLGWLGNAAETLYQNLLCPGHRRNASINPCSLAIVVGWCWWWWEGGKPQRKETTSFCLLFVGKKQRMQQTRNKQMVGHQCARESTRLSFAMHGGGCLETNGAVHHGLFTVYRAMCIVYRKRTRRTVYRVPLRAPRAPAVCKTPFPIFGPWGAVGQKNYVVVPLVGCGAVFRRFAKTVSLFAAGVAKHVAAAKV
eukprot:m.64983 g.64983  ORF g.64983 m.64983 type:complete len:476 (-) comp13631_c0_seq1:832-2259(-)